MEKGYNIDDILSEVQKRREENEAKIKSDNEAAQKVVEEVINSKKPEPVVEDITPSEETEEESQDTYSQTTNDKTQEPVQEAQPVHRKVPESKAEKPVKKVEAQAQSAKKAPKTDTASLEPINLAPKKSKKRLKKRMTRTLLMLRK